MRSRTQGEQRDQAAAEAEMFFYMQEQTLRRLEFRRTHKILMSEAVAKVFRVFAALSGTP